MPGRPKLQGGTVEGDVIRQRPRCPNVRGDRKNVAENGPGEGHRCDMQISYIMSSCSEGDPVYISMRSYVPQ